VIESYNELYEAVTSAIDSYMKKNESSEIIFGKNENESCFISNKQNGNKLVFMFARYGEEFKVGFALYVTDPYGGMSSGPEWVQDSFSHCFTEEFIHILIDDHLIKEYKQDW